MGINMATSAETSAMKDEPAARPGHSFKGELENEIIINIGKAQSRATVKRRVKERSGGLLELAPLNNELAGGR